MNGKTPMTVTGNLTADVEVKFTPTGTAVANFTVASTPRVYNRQSNQWEDGQALFMRCRVWREQAENIAESKLRKGTRVMVTGELTQRSWEDDEGGKHTIYELDAHDVAASMRFAQVAVRKIARNVQDPKGNGRADAEKSDFGDDPPSF
ncbi:single-stranded DNA-binding protein [Nocardia sp. NPDC003963]